MDTTNNDGLTVKDVEKTYMQEGHNIRRWIRAGKVKAVKVGDGYRIDRVSLETFLAKKQESKIATATKPEQAAVVTAGSQPTQAPATFAIPLEVSAGIEAAVKQPEQQPSQTASSSSKKSSLPFDLRAGAKTKEEIEIVQALRDNLIQPSDDLTTRMRKQAMVNALVEKASHLKPKPAQGPVQPAPVAAPAAHSGAAAVQKRRQPRGDSKPPASVAAGQSVQGNAPDNRRQGKEARREAGKKYKKGPVRYAKDAMRHLDIAQMLDVRDWLLRRMDQKMRPL